jgi:hypothetical protein
MFLNNSADSVPTMYLIFLDDMLNISEDDYDWGQIVLSCLYFNLSRVGRLHSWSFASASDVVVDMILD